MGRVVAIGLDSGSREIVDALARQGTLPALGRLRGRAARFGLRSGPAHRHGMLWPQFVTGRPARLDGEWLRMTFDPADYGAYQEPALSRTGGSPPFWDRARVPTTVFDVPRTTCGGPGVQVTAWGAHAPLHPRAANPAGLLDELDARFGVHPGCGNDYECGWHDPSRLEHLTRGLVDGARRRGRIARHLQDRFPSELFVTAMSETHSLSEFAWHGVDREHPLAPDRGAHAARLLTRVYRAIDDAIGELVDHAGSDTDVVVFSLDGIRPGHGDLPSIVLLPELMHRLAFGTGLLRDPDQDAWRRAGFPPVVPRRGLPWRLSMDEYLVDGGTPGMRTRITHHPAYQRVRRTAPARLAMTRLRGVQHGALGLPIPGESHAGDGATRREPMGEVLFIGNYQPHWHRMPAFALPTFGDGYVRVNLEGRERHGVVAPADYARTCGELERMLGAIRNPRTGRRAVLDVERVDGDPLDRSVDRYADLVVRWSEPIDAFEHPAVGTIGPFPLHRTGTHADGGFAWIAGPGVAPGDRGEGSVADLPPTMLDLLGRPVPAGVVGASLLGTRAGGAPRVPSLSATGR
ncbi:MAG TPA: hypothetical protein VFW74_16140 [Acidimicrobiia bacterium]|nr:hypothetical protein [Acidimicrobiia bacterium]